MPLARSVNRSAVMLLGAFWAVLLVVGGATLPTSRLWNDWPAMPTTSRAGLSSVSVVVVLAWVS